MNIVAFQVMNILPVSVIIPTYNREHFLQRALDSVFSQTCKCGEVIVVDDGSDDGTKYLIDSLKGRCGKSLRYIFQENKGPASARNLGVAHAENDVIAFLDSDDHWYPEKLQKQFTLMEMNPQYLISYTREKWLRNGTHLNQKKKHTPRHGDIFLFCLDFCMVGMSTLMVRKELFSCVGMFDLSYQCCEDYEFWLRASCRYPFLLADEILTVKEGGRTDQVSYEYRIGMDKLRIQAIEKLLLQGILDFEQTRLAMKELMKKAVIYGNGCVRHGKNEEGEYYLCRAASIQEMI